MKLISRTVNETIYKVIVMNIETMQARTVDVSVGSNEFKSDDKALEFIRKSHDNDTVKTVAIVGKSLSSSLLVMTEEEFIRRAVKVSDMKEARSYFKKTQGIDVEDDSAEA